MNDALTWVLDLVQGVDPVLRTLLAGLGIMLETSILVGLIVPGDTIVLVASTGVSGPFQYVAMVVTVIVGALAGESLGFALGRFFGPKIRASALGRRIGEANWARAQRYLDRRGGIAVFLSRFLPVLHSLIPLTVGMSTMSYRRFLAWTVPACAIWTVAYVSVGSATAAGFRELASKLHWAGFAVVGIVVAFLLLAFLVKKLIVRAEARHMVEGSSADAPDSMAE